MIKTYKRTTLALMLAAASSSGLYAQQATVEKKYALEEVVVTASKREESLLEVMGSVTALTGDTLKQQNIQDFKSLVEMVPGMVAQDEGKIAIRGISRTRGGPSPVAFHVNDVFIADRGEPFYDLSAVEILRGPSGTLFGRNATAGAINAKWARPDVVWSTGGSYRYSSLTQNEIKAFANIPLLGEDNPGLLARVAVFSRQGDGILDNLLTSDADDPGNSDEQFARIYLTSELSDSLNVALRAIRYESTPGGASTVASPSLSTRRSGELERLGTQPLPDDVTKVRSRVDQVYGEAFSEFTRIDGEFIWALSDVPGLGSFDVVLVGGRQWGERRDTFDLDGTEEPITDGRVNVDDDIRSTAELRFVSQNNSGIEWLTGFFWYRQTATNALKVDARTFISLSDIGAGPAFPGEPEFISDVDVETEGERILDHSKAIFLNFDFDLAQLFGGPNVIVTAGIRENRDEFSLKTAESNIAISIPALNTGSIPVANATNLHQFADFKEVTGELGARWFYSDEGMVYGEFSRGYKPGLAQRIDRPDGTVIQNPVDPEFLNALELGWKTSFFDRTLTMATAAFYYDYTNLQVSQITPGGVITDNAASATIRGFEVESQWSPTPSFYLQASAAWTDARYDEYCGTDTARGENTPIDAGCNNENPHNFDDERLTAAPKFSAALLASYTWFLESSGSIAATIRSSWSDDIDRRGLGNPNDNVDAYSTTDFRLAWESPRQTWRIEGFVENIEDNNDIFFQAFTPIAVGSQPDTFANLFNLPPRIYGVQVDVHF